MAYRVRNDGTIECDNADEALELQAKMALRSNSGRTVPNHGRNGASITGLGREFLKVVLDAPGIKPDDAAQRLNKTVASFPPMHRAIRAWARLSGIDPDQLFVRRLGEQGTPGFEIQQEYRPRVEAAVKD
jgi:hypothetical protein